jgi:hypothetical protein
LLYNPNRDLIRLPGTFVSPWQWSWFLVPNAFFTYITSVSDPSRLWRIISRIGMGFVLGAAIISGQRLALVMVPLVFLLLLILTEQNKKRLSLTLGVSATLTIILANYLELIQHRLDSLVSRWNYSPPQDFVTNQFWWVVQNRLHWLGNGLGTATNAGRRFGKTHLIETFYANVLYEIGPFGLLALLGVVSILVFFAFKAYRSLKTPALSRLGMGILLFLVLISYNTYYYPLNVDPVNVYYWFMAGVLLKLPEIEPKIVNS